MQSSRSITTLPPAASGKTSRMRILSGTATAAVGGSVHASAAASGVLLPAAGSNHGGLQLSSTSSPTGAGDMGCDAAAGAAAKVDGVMSIAGPNGSFAGGSDGGSEQDLQQKSPTTSSPQSMEQQRISSSSRGKAKEGGAGVRYRECLKNHAANIGGHANDGCGEFMASGEGGSLEALRCAACGCHRNFHRREIVGEVAGEPVTSGLAANSAFGCDNCSRFSAASHHLLHHHHHEMMRGEGKMRMIEPLGHLPLVPLHPAAARPLALQPPPPQPPPPPPPLLGRHFAHHSHHHSAGAHPQQQHHHHHHMMMMGFNSPPPHGHPHPASAVLDPDEYTLDGSGLLSPHKKRFRTKFTSEQKEQMCAFAERIGWRIQKQDEEAIRKFCADIGVKRHVLKVWMHNNKHTFGKRHHMHLQQQQMGQMNCISAAMDEDDDEAHEQGNLRSLSPLPDD